MIVCQLLRNGCDLEGAHIDERDCEIHARLGRELVAALTRRMNTASNVGRLRPLVYRSGKKPNQ